MQFAAGHFHAFEKNRVLLWTKLQIVGDINRGNDDAQFLRGLFSNRPDAVQEIAALLNVDNADQAVANFHCKAVHSKESGRLIGRRAFFLFRSGWLRAPQCGCARWAASDMT